MPSPGECIAGRYRLECPLGEGGMGSVWRARHLELDAPVAVKFQHAHRARSKGAAARFRKEARAAARLKSPNVVRVVDFGIDGDVPYLAMELLEGESLRARLERQVMSSVEEVLEITRQAASALDAAHQAGIVHRDFKPSNLFLVKSGEREIVKLLDFGIAKWFEAEASVEGALTDDNLVVGSAHYMSPEQARGEDVDPRSDVWSLAVVAYQLLTGLVPFHGANIPDALRRICSGHFDPPSRVLSDDYAAFDAVFSRAFELDLDLRFETAGEFSSALTAAGQNLLGSNTPRALPPASTGAWAFGRDAATLSLPLRPARSTAQPSRRTVALAAVALALIGALALAVSQAQSPLPAVASAARHAPVVAPPPRVQVTQEPAPAAIAEAPLTVNSSVPVSTSPKTRKAPTPQRPRLPATGAPQAPQTAIVSAAEPPAANPRVDSVPAPAPTLREEAPAQLDPVFGLQIPARR
jgi:eukaryotic-like serine/threonine-protein kinase